MIRCTGAFRAVGTVPASSTMGVNPELSCAKT